MVRKNPFVVGSGLSRLVVADFDKSLRAANVYTRESRWTSEAVSLGLHLDLSQVEWVELDALVSMLLLIEKAKVDGIRTTITMPHPGDPTASEQASNRRAAVIQYLEYLRFRQAAQIAHVFGPDVTFRVSSQPISNGETPQSTGSNQREPLYRYVFPLVWLSSRDRPHVESLATFLRAVVGDPGRGLHPLDAAAIANVLLFELIDNADRHSESTGFALVAARGHTASDIPRSLDTYSVDRDYLSWLRRSERPFIEIVIGDSGKGVHSTLKGAFDRAVEANQVTKHPDWSDDASVIGWALDRWSTRDSFDSKRGTRGLYRVDRVVTKYEGLLSVRSGSTVVAADHGGPAHDQLLFRDDLAFMPGSVIRLWVPAFREVPEPRDTKTAHENLRFRFVRLGTLTKDGISSEAKQRLARSLRQKTQYAVCVVAVIDGGIETRHAIEAALAQAAETRHPGALILLGLPGGWDLVSGAVESVNLEHDRARRADEHAASEHFEIWDPVLVIGKSDTERIWVGATEGVRLTLAALLNSSRVAAKQLQTLVPDAAQRGDVRRILRNDPALVLLHGNGDIALRVGLNGLASYVRNVLHRHIVSNRDGVQQGPFITPSLTRVEIWLDVPHILDSVCTPAVALFILAADLRRLPSFVRPTVILVDSSVPLRHAELLKRFLDAERIEVMLGELTVRNAEGLRTLEPGTSVVVYTDVISSGESAGRCIAQVLRDGAQLLAVACLVDARKEPTDGFDFYGHNLPLANLTRVQLHSLRPRRGRRDESPRYISPLTHEPERDDPRQPFTVYDLGSEAIARILVDAKALHFRHIANRSLNRHFTLYADSTRAVTDERVALSTIRNIKAWQREQGFEPIREGFELWHASDPGGTSALGRLAELVAAGVHPTQVRAVQRRSAFGRWSFSINELAGRRARSVVILDWSATTGNTIVGLLNLAAAQGADQVLMVVFLSQLAPADESFFRQVRALSSPAYGTEQLSLLSSAQSVQRKRRRPGHGGQPKGIVNTRVNFISRFETEPYAPGTCPACKHLGRMAAETYPTPFLADYAASFKARRLRRWHKHEVSSGLADSIGAPDMDGRTILRIVWFRGLLQEALASTQKRAEVLSWCTRIVEQLESGGAIKDDAAACLHFLSMELQWLARPPLHFPQLRAVLGRLCRAVITIPGWELDTVVSALVVYRAGAKIEFAKAFTELFEHVRLRPDALGQLMYSAFTFINRPYVQAPKLLRPLMEALRHIERAHSPAESGNDVAATLRALAARADFEYARGFHDQDTPFIAWRRLRTALEGEHDRPHPATMVGITEMLPGSDAVIIEQAVQRFEAGDATLLDPDIIDWIRNLEVAWIPCRRFLDRTLLPLMGKMSSIINGDDFESYVGPDTAARLREYVRAGVPSAESPFGRLIRELALTPERLLERRNWVLFRNEVLWFYEHIFRPADPSGTPTGLIEFLRSAPTSLTEAITVVERAVSSDSSDLILERSGSISGTGLSVFCPDGLLRELLKHLLKNAGQTHRDGARTPGLRFSAREDRDRITLLAGSWHTRVTADFGSSSHAGGLTDLRRRLKAFGGVIELDARPKNPRFSFTTRIEFSV